MALKEHMGLGYSKCPFERIRGLGCFDNRGHPYWMKNLDVLSSTFCPVSFTKNDFHFNRAER